jgi:thiol-disulfide isomerase/thioredoxin
MFEQINLGRRSFMSTAALAIAASQLAGCTSDAASPGESGLPVEGRLPYFGGGGQWFNAEPPAAEDLRGKVVLVQFLTYTCINWLRTLPYVRAWDQKYREHGLVVIGVHTPEFEFEKNPANVRQALKTLDVDFPVVLDNDYEVWRAFANHYWPALYFVDAQGRIRHHRFGEGDYDRSERVLQQLLIEAGAEGVDDDPVAVAGQGVQAAADWEHLGSPESYLGYERTGSSASGNAVRDVVHTYTAPDRLGINEWALAGDWIVRADSVALGRSGGRIVLQSHARDVHLVMGPVEPGTSVRFRVLLDGRPPDASHGSDIDTTGNGVLSAQRLYQLIRQPQPITDRRFEIEFLDPGAEAFAFTFG